MNVPRASHSLAVFRDYQVDIMFCPRVKIGEMGAARDIAKLWIGPLLRLVCLQILARGIVLFIGARGYHPEEWVARMLTVAHAALGLEAIRWMLSGALGLVIQLSVEGYLNGWFRSPHRVYTPSETEIRHWHIPSPAEVLRPAAKWTIGWIKRGLSYTHRLICYWTPGLLYQVAQFAPSEDAGEFARMSPKTVWFDLRFSDAFPGIHEPTTFTNRGEIAHRLGILLRQPLSAKNNGSVSQPVWWTRGGQDFYVTTWVRLKPSVFLMWPHELMVSKVVAIPGNAYWQMFVYVECEAQKPIGLYEYESGYIENVIRQRGSYSEEYCVSGHRAYTRGEYDDGGYARHGRVQQFKRSPDLRIRNLSKWNFLIVPGSSPVQTQEFENGLRNRLNACLRNPGRVTRIDRLATHASEKLSRRERGTVLGLHVNGQASWF